MKSSSQSRKKSGLSWTRRERRRNIERSGVWKQTGTGARCGRGSKFMKMPGKCTRPKVLSKRRGKMGKTTFGSRPGQKNAQAGRGPDMVQKGKVSQRKKDCGIWRKTKPCKPEVPSPGKKEMSSESTRRCVKKMSSAVG